jgi:hypothetical protein
VCVIKQFSDCDNEELSVMQTEHEKKLSSFLWPTNNSNLLTLLNKSAKSILQKKINEQKKKRRDLLNFKFRER